MYPNKVQNTGTVKAKDSRGLSYVIYELTEYYYDDSIDEKFRGWQVFGKQYQLQNGTPVNKISDTEFQIPGTETVLTPV